MKVTIKDIAQKLDLNFSSVSRALNNKPGVSEKTRKLVIKTAEEMGYRPNVIARGLVSNTTQTIGILMPDIVNPLFGELTTAIIETAKESGYDVFLCISNWSDKKEADNFHAIQQKQVDGIVAKTVSDDCNTLLRNSNVPVVGYESWMNNNTYSSVSTDNVQAGYIAATHIIECGYKNPGIIHGPENSSAGIYRREGIQKAYKEYGMKYKKSMVYLGEYNLKSGYNLAKKLLKEHPDCDSVFAGNDMMALGVIEYLEEQGIKPGKEFGVIGFDNINVSHLPQISLTTVKQPKYSMGRIITKLLLGEIENKKNGIKNFPQRILLEPELIVRGTTAKRD